MILGAVPAGGASRRMGRDKAFVEVRGRTMLERVTGAVGAVADGVVVVGRTDVPGGLADPPGAGAGPLAGLVTALQRGSEIGAIGVLLVAVDQPFVRVTTLRRLVDRFDGEAVLPLAEGVRQVTCAVYPCSGLEAATAELGTGGSIQSLLGRLPHTVVPPDTWAAWGEDGASWFSVDDLAALATGMDRYGSGLE